MEWGPPSSREVKDLEMMWITGGPDESFQTSSLLNAAPETNVTANRMRESPIRSLSYTVKEMNKREQICISRG